MAIGTFFKNPGLVKELFAETTRVSPTSFITLWRRALGGSLREIRLDEFIIYGVNNIYNEFGSSNCNIALPL